jgi:hypothetical protein
MGEASSEVVKLNNQSARLAEIGRIEEWKDERVEKKARFV